MDFSPGRAAARPFLRAAAYPAAFITCLWAAMLLLIALTWTDSALPERADAILVPGASVKYGVPSPELRERLDRAAELYARGVAPVIIVSGGTVRGFIYNEAQVMRDYLCKAGVPPQAVLAEPRALSTRQNMRFSAQLLSERTGGNRVVLVTSGYHMLRARISANRAGLAPAGYAPCAVPGFLTAVARVLREGLALIEYAFY